MPAAVPSFRPNASPAVTSSRQRTGPFFEGTEADPPGPDGAWWPH